jgi:transcriptional regulator with XRE-family HTH domain
MEPYVVYWNQWSKFRATGRKYTMSKNDQPQTVAEIIKATRSSQTMNTRDFGEALGISHAAISKLENGESEPGKDNLAAWFNDERDWVYTMAKEIFVARYRASLEAVRGSHPIAIPA